MALNGNIKTNIFQKLEKFGDLFIINILFIITSIPIFTIGAATTAMYAFTTKLVKDQEGPVWKSYWSAFKKNFKPATKVWLVILVILAAMYVEYVLSFSMGGLGYALILGLMALEAVFLSFTLPMLFPMVARYENTTGNYIKNSFLICIANLGSWFYMFFIWVLPIALYASNNKILYYTWVLWLIILIGVIAYASSMVVVRLYDKIENPDGEAVETDEEDDDSTVGKVTKQLVDITRLKLDEKDLNDDDLDELLDEDEGGDDKDNIK